MCFGSNEAIYSWTFRAENPSPVLLSWHLNSLSPAYQFTESFSFGEFHGWEKRKWFFGLKRSSSHWCGVQTFHNTEAECFLPKSLCLHASGTSHHRLMITLLLFLNLASLWGTVTVGVKVYTQQDSYIFNNYWNYLICSLTNSNTIYTQQRHQKFLWP